MKAVLSVILSLFLIVPVSARDGDTTIGIASWYGYPYHGRHAANGEVYDMEKLTAAHRTLAFGTRVRVINLHNERSVEVRITDRGPFIDGRIIDLSHAAAQAVDMVAPGITPVRLEIIGPVTNDSTARFAVQVGAFRVRRNAERFLAMMNRRYGAGHITLREGDPDLWRVLVGSEHSEEGARELAARIRLESAQPGSFIARLD